MVIEVLTLPVLMCPIRMKEPVQLSYIKTGKKIKHGSTQKKRETKLNNDYKNSFVHFLKNLRRNIQG